MFQAEGWIDEKKPVVEVCECTKVHLWKEHFVSCGLEVSRRLLEIYSVIVWSLST